MEDNDNPYTILGVKKDATKTQIKSAYRKLALRHHPDKQSTEDGRKEATIIFAKISNAYEIIGDDAQRQNYDRDSRAKVNRPRSKQPRRNTAAEDFLHHTQFHDPFSVFESVFRDEFGANFFGRHGMNNMHQQHFNNMRQSPFNDPFFGGGGGSLFGNDPFFNGGGMGMGAAARDPFMGGGMMGSPMMGGGMFAAMNQQMNQMMNMHQSMMQQQQRPPLQADPYSRQQRQQLPRQQQQSSVTYSTSSSSNLMGGRNGERVTHSTTTQIINGKRQTVKERIVQKPDGTVERHVDLSGDDGFPQQQQQQQQQLPSSSHQSQRQVLEAGQATKESKRRSSKRKDLFKRKRRDSSNLEG